MRRRKSVFMSAGIAPLELQNEFHEVWQSAKQTRAWLVRHSLPVGVIPECPPLTRHQQAARAWAVAQGMVKTYGASSYQSPDFNLMREAGIAAGHGGRRIEERLRAAGVQIEL